MRGDDVTTCPRASCPSCPAGGGIEPLADPPPRPYPPKPVPSPFYTSRAHLHRAELEGGTVSRERRAATAALDGAAVCCVCARARVCRGAGGCWMRPLLALSAVTSSHGRTRDRTERRQPGARRQEGGGVARAPASSDTRVEGTGGTVSR